MDDWQIARAKTQAEERYKSRVGLTAYKAAVKHIADIAQTVGINRANIVTINPVTTACNNLINNVRTCTSLSADTVSMDTLDTVNSVNINTVVNPVNDVVNKVARSLTTTLNNITVNNKFLPLASLVDDDVDAGTPSKRAHESDADSSSPDSAAPPAHSRRRADATTPTSAQKSQSKLFIQDPPPKCKTQSRSPSTSGLQSTSCSRTRPIDAHYGVNPDIVIEVVQRPDVKDDTPIPGKITVVLDRRRMHVDLDARVKCLMIGGSNLRNINLNDVLPDWHIICIPGVNVQYTRLVLDAIPFDDLYDFEDLVVTSGINNRGDVGAPPIIECLRGFERFGRVACYYVGISVDEGAVTPHELENIRLINRLASEYIGKYYISPVTDCTFKNSIHYDDRTLHNIIVKINEFVRTFLSQD